MRFKTSCFNPAILKSDFRRFWPLGVTVFAVLALLILLPLQGAISGDSPMQSALQSLYGAGFAMIVTMAAAGFLAALFVFHHLHARAEIQFFHGLPLRRRCLFATSFVSGFLLLLLPLTAVGLIAMALGASVGNDAMLAAVRLWGAGLSSGLLFYALAVLSCVLAGQSFGALLLFGGMNCAAFIISMGIDQVAARFMPGIDFGAILSGPVSWLTPISKLISAVSTRYSDIDPSLAENSFYVNQDSVASTAVGFAVPSVFWIYALIAVLLAVLSGVLYQIRRAETAGDLVSFSAVRLLSRIFGALTVSVGAAVLVFTSGLFQGEIPFSAVLISVLGGAAVGWIAVDMLVYKTLRVFRRKSTLSGGILVLILLFLLCAGQMDLFGVVHDIPDAQSVSAASVTYAGQNSIAVTPEDAAALQAVVLQNTDCLTNNTYNRSYTTLDFDYSLQSGREIHRSYTIRDTYDENYNRLSDVVTDAARALLSKPDYCYQTLFAELPGGVTADNFYASSLAAYNWDENGDSNSRITSSSSDWLGDSQDFTSAEAVALYQAVCQDIQDGNVVPGGFSSADVIATIDFQCYTQPYSTSFGTYQDFSRAVPVSYVSVDLNASMANTISCLEDLGFTFQLD